MSGSNQRIQHKRLKAHPIAGHEPREEAVLGCIKVAYATQKEAHAANTGLRAYKCRMCRQWHHTHLEREPPPPR